MTWKYEPPPARLTADQCAQVRERLTMAAVAGRYGFNVERGRIICPFHNDTKPSCVVYPGDKGFYCYACNTGGSVLDFVGKLLGLNYFEAAARLDADFGLGIDSAPVNEQALQQWRQQVEEKNRIARQKAHNANCMALEMRAIRNLPRPTNAQQAQIWATERARLEYLEYLCEESMLPDDNT